MDTMHLNFLESDKVLLEVVSSFLGASAKGWSRHKSSLPGRQDMVITAIIVTRTTYI